MSFLVFTFLISSFSGDIFGQQYKNNTGNASSLSVSKAIPPFQRDFFLGSEIFNEDVQLRIENNIYVAWIETMGHFTGIEASAGKDFDANSSKIMFTRSTDNGTTFEKPIQVTDSYNIRDLKLIANSNNIFLTAMQQSDSNHSQHQIMFVRSTDSGKTFEKPQILATLKDQSFYLANSFYVTANQKTIYLSIVENFKANTTNKIMLLKSTDNGLTFENTTSITSRPYISMRGLEAFGNSVYLVAVSDGKILLFRSGDSGNTFGKPLYINQDLGNNSRVGQVFLNSANKSVFITWEQQIRLDNRFSTNIFTKISNDQGVHFNNLKQLSALPRVDSVLSSIKYSENDQTFYVIYCTVNPAGLIMFYGVSKTNDLGMNFAHDFLPNIPGRPTYPFKSDIIETKYGTYLIYPLVYAYQIPGDPPNPPGYYLTIAPISDNAVKPTTSTISFVRGLYDFLTAQYHDKKLYVLSQIEESTIDLKEFKLIG